VVCVVVCVCVWVCVYAATGERRRAVVWSTTHELA